MYTSSHNSIGWCLCLLQLIHLFLVYSIWHNWVCDNIPPLQFIGYKLSFNYLTNPQKKLAWISTHPLFTEPDGKFGHHQASFNTTDAELGNISVLFSWLCAIMSKKSINQGKYVTPTPLFCFYQRASSTAKVISLRIQNVLLLNSVCQLSA